MRILVIGDAMLDRYWHGSADRISPEAPVPVVNVERIEDRPGGAANVAANVRALGAEATLVSVIGADDPGYGLKALCKWRCAWVTDAMPTTVKLRVVGRNQQLIRCDFEARPSDEALSDLTQWYESELASADRVILSDYGKGALTRADEIVEMALDKGLEVYVDPKGHDWTRYRGATLVKPNLDELREAIGPWESEAALEKRATDLRRELGIKAILVTRAAKGMSLFDATGAKHIAAVAREVYDVTGAGDTAIATLASSVGDMSQRMVLANKASGVVCGKFGTAVATRAEVFG
jgi:D-glycero-beta-D-manno-heptose-7-phosphate kinase